MIALFILSLPFLAYSLAVVGGKDLLLPYATTGLLIFYFFMHKSDFKICFPKEAYLFIVYISYLSLSLLFHSSMAAKSLSQLITTVLYLFFYLLIVNILVIQNLKSFLKIVNSFIFVCVVFSVYSSLQAFSPAKSIFYSLFRNAYNAFFIWVPHGVSHIQWGGLNRVTGLGCEPSIWAAFLTTPLSLLIPRLIANRKRKDLFMFSVLFVCLLLTYGRTGWLSFLFVIILSPVFIFSGIERISFVLIALGIISALYFSVMFFGVGVAGDWSRYERLVGLQNAWQMFLSSPLFGVGLGRFEANLAAVRPDSFGGYIGWMSYNWYLSVLAETGIIGLSGWLIFLYAFWRIIISQYDRLNDNKELKALYVGLGLAFLSIVFSWLNVNGINFMYIWFVFALISSLPVVVGREMGESAGIIELKENNAHH